jgi:hypothetical protein
MKSHKRNTSKFFEIGKETSKIDVQISYRIIQLFSEGLYASPNKAIEELVSNAFDAGASNVHVQLSPDLSGDGASIAVVDDGEGMDAAGLRQHWLIGVSNKRNTKKAAPKGRRQIGKFGIGKLATYVLSKRLTHICKRGAKYFSTSIDYRQIPEGTDGGIFTEKKVELALRELTNDQAAIAVAPWVAGMGEGFKALKLFGKGAAESWTVAVMSDLKEMAADIRLGRLRWVLSTAMPLRDDFRLFLNGESVESSKLESKRSGRWVLGKELKKLPKPDADDLQPTVKTDAAKDSDLRYGLTHPKLGRITGYAELYEDLLTAGKSTDLERSHGFFVYVHGRLINIDDEYFGIDRNQLRHGTFSRFRMVAHIDRLDEVLRSSREAISQGELYNIARNILRAVFDHARQEHRKLEERQLAGELVANRVASSPGSLTRRPLVGLAEMALKGTSSPRLATFPSGLTPEAQKKFLDDLQARAQTPEGLVRDVRLSDLSQERGIALWDAETGTLDINTLHPFVAYFLDEFEDRQQRLPLELFAASEVLLEANLYQHGLAEEAIQDILTQRDELLRFLSRSATKRNAFAIAQALLDAANDKDRLEKELVAAFDNMGFDAVPKGGPSKPDGIAEAFLPASDAGQPQKYKVSLEAKSKEQQGKKVSNQGVRVSAIARQRDEFGCDHAIIVGPDFSTTKGDNSAVVKEIKADKEKTKKTITLVKIFDLARLVRLVPRKRIGLGRLRGLFAECGTPEEAKAWVDSIESEKAPRPPYKEILQTIWEVQNEVPNEAVEYAAITTSLRKGSGKITMSRNDLVEHCKALANMAPGLIFARDRSVELNQRPDKVLDAIRAILKDYPSDEQPIEKNGESHGKLNSVKKGKSK